MQYDCVYSGAREARTMNAQPAPAAPEPRKRRHGRFAPAKTSREADERWGLGNVGRAQRGEIDAYTAEHFAEDEAAGIVVMPVARECPRHRPERACKPRDVPRYYRTAWLRRTTGRPRAARPVAIPATPVRLARDGASGSRSVGRELYRGRAEDDASTAAPSPRPSPRGAGDRLRRTTARMPVICYDCATWLDWRAQRDFADEVGDDVARNGRPTLAEAGAKLKQLLEQAHRDYARLLPLTGPLPLSMREPLDWPKIIAIAAAVDEAIEQGEPMEAILDLVSRFCG